MLLLIDNYDSFTYNLFQYLSELGEKVVVIRNDKATLEEIEEMKPQRIVISPGPSTPLQAGISNDIIRHFGPRLPILGVCLGHQCIGYSYGATIGQAKEYLLDCLILSLLFAITHWLCSAMDSLTALR
jgi:anthranilate synthase component 2